MLLIYALLIVAKLIVTINGTTASGKSIVVRKVAKITGFAYFSTGLLYRSVTQKLVDDCVDWRNVRAVVEACGNMKFVLKLKKQDSIKVFNVEIDGVNLEEKVNLRSPKVNFAVPTIAAYPEVRKQLLPVHRGNRHRSIQLLSRAGTSAQ